MKRQPRRRRLLALIVHAQDLAQQSRRAAITSALLAPTNALDFLQLRAVGGDDPSHHALVDAGKRLQELLAAAQHARSNSSHLPVKQPALILNAPLEAIASLTGKSPSAFDGWHVKERDLFRADLQQMIQQTRAHSDQTIVGCSVHSVASAIHAARLGVDYIQAGTMFSTPSHPEKVSAEQLEGPQLLRAILAEGSANEAELSLPPLIAVGGINTPQQIQQVLSAGASGVAVIRGILAATDARATAAQYRAVLDAH
ncbi:Thiamine-phosphate pyrophosphorylase [Globisporangium polare]